MRVVFRTDASVFIGSGHVMRCLTLADALAVQGADCLFICREHQGNLIEQIRNKGYRVHVLPVMSLAEVNSPAIKTASDEQALAHSHWLGATQADDAAACTAILTGAIFDWLIVDHYALDARWELALKPHYYKLMVIDDLADRPHICDLLLDQTFGRHPEDYRDWLPANCQLLCGSQYALLRPEFAALRGYSLERRAHPQLCQLLISMGGVDKDNITCQVLEALRGCQLPAKCEITVVMGVTAPWLDEVRRQAQSMPWLTTVLVGVSNMAQLMADSDLAIGAAGATSWERCCLGLPTIMLILADNQRYVAQGLERAGAVQVLNDAKEIAYCLPALLSGLASSQSLQAEMCEAAASIVDGRGIPAVVHNLEC